MICIHQFPPIQYDSDLYSERQKKLYIKKNIYNNKLQLILF